MCMKHLLKYSFFLNICFKFLTTELKLSPLPRVYCKLKPSPWCYHYFYPHSRRITTANIAKLLWYYGSNHSTTAILIPCQSLSLTAKTSWTYTTWLINQNSILHCMLVQWSVVAWKHHWDAQWWRWPKSDIQSSVWNCANILLATPRKHLGPGTQRPVCRRHLHHYW